MASMTLLDYVQQILNESGSDEVNSISDTIEATRVANIVRSVYKDLITEFDLPVKKQLIALEGLGNTAKPNYMKIPSNVNQIDWIRYDCREQVTDNKAYREIEYKSPDDFVTFVNGRPSTDTANYVVVNDSANIPLVISIIDGPTYWTSFDDTYIVFDAYDAGIDSTLQSSKSMCSCSILDDLALTDTAIPAIPENLERVLYIQALNRVLNADQDMNQKTERVENRMRVRLQRNKWRESRMLNEGPDYGRR